MLDHQVDRFRATGFSALILCAVTCGWVRTAHANPVYECRGADASIAFQDHPCAAAQAESRVEIAPPPAPSPSPDYERPSREDGRVSPHALPSARRSARERGETISYECHAADGEVFYRHGACPKQIAANGSARGTSRAHSGSGGQTFTVSAEAMPRSEVCRRMASAGSIGRAGHERDESVSTYDRNLGRDPCRYF